MATAAATPAKPCATSSRSTPAISWSPSSPHSRAEATSRRRSSPMRWRPTASTPKQPTPLTPSSVGAPTPLAVTGKAEADALVNRDPLALLLGMLLDQQVPMEWAFAAPYTLHQRLGHLDVTRIVDAGPEALTAAFCAKPALHRYPAAMATRAYALSQHLVDHYAARPAAVWAGADTGDELYARLRAL